jgi:hypothetical protein
MGQISPQHVELLRGPALQCLPLIHVIPMCVVKLPVTADLQECGCQTEAQASRPRADDMYPIVSLVKALLDRVPHTLPLTMSFSIACRRRSR